MQAVECHLGILSLPRPLLPPVHLALGLPRRQRQRMLPLTTAVPGAAVEGPEARGAVLVALPEGIGVVALRGRRVRRRRAPLASARSTTVPPSR